MRHLDLFSGIGGFALAAEMVWDKVEHVFCEIDPFCQAVLRKHWPDALIYGDIRQLTADPDREREPQPQGGLEEFRRWAGDGVDLLTGGFPCQPFSAAGRRHGTEDDRHLWPEMLRVIREVRPRFVLGENVGGFLTWDGGMVFESVCADLEAEGYEVCPLVIPSAGVGAPHLRERVWIAAHAVSAGAGGESRPTDNEIRGTGEGGAARLRQGHGAAGAGRVAAADTDASDSSRGGRRKGNPERGRIPARKGEMGTEKRGGFTYVGSDGAWREDWPSVAARLCTMDDGLPNGLARPKGWRNAALKGAGNAIVPQVAAEIMRGIKKVDAP